MAREHKLIGANSSGNKFRKTIIGAAALALTAGSFYTYNALSKDDSQNQPDSAAQTSSSHYTTAPASIEEILADLQRPNGILSSSHDYNQAISAEREEILEDLRALHTQVTQYGSELKQELQNTPVPSKEPSVQNCTIPLGEQWNNSYLNCDSITMETSLAKGQKSLFERGVPQEVVTRNFKEMQDYLVSSGQLDEVIDNIYVENKDGERVWKKAGEDCGDGLNDVWDNAVYTITFSPDVGTWMPNPTNTPQTALDCESCDETAEPIDDRYILKPGLPEGDVAAPDTPELPETKPNTVRQEPVVRREADYYCMAENLAHNNEFPHTYTRHSKLRQEAKDMGLDTVVAGQQINGNWHINIPTRQAFGLMPSNLTGDTITTYFDMVGDDGLLDSKLVTTIDYDHGQADKKGTYRNVFKNLHKTTEMSDLEITANQNLFADGLVDIRNSPDFLNCESINEPAPEYVVVKQEPQERETVYVEVPAETPTQKIVIHEEVRPTTEVRGEHRHDHYCDRSVGHAPVHRPRFGFHASYSNVKIRGHGPVPQFRGGHGGYRGYQSRPVNPFFNFRGSIRHGGPSSSDMLNHRLRGYRGH